MIGLLALTALAGVDPPRDPAPGIEAFREACMQGSLKLSPDRGRVLKHNVITSFADVFEWGRPTSPKTAIKLNTPPETYLVLADYTRLQPKSIAHSCSLVSDTVSHEQATAAFLEGLPDRNLLPHRVWINLSLPIWRADHPELGYRKTLYFRSDGSVVIQVELYETKDTRMNSEAAKQ